MNDIGSIKHYPRMVKMLHYWEDLPRIGRFPNKKIIDPYYFPKDLFPHVALFEVIDDQRDFKVILMGSRIRREFPVNPSGKRLSDFHTPENMDYLWQSVELVRRTGLPVYSESMNFGIGTTFKKTVRLICPFSQINPDELSHVLAWSEFTIDHPSDPALPTAVSSVEL